MLLPEYLLSFPGRFAYWLVNNELGWAVITFSWLAFLRLA